MNSNRLSTSGKPPINRIKLIEDITKFLSKPSNYEYQEDGKTYIISENRLLLPRGNRGKPVRVALISSEGDVINTFNSIGDCAKFLDIVPSAVVNRLRKGLIFRFKNNLCFIKKSEGYREVVLPADEKLSKSTPGGVPSGTLLRSPQETELINTVTKERKVFPSLRAVALYLRELNPEYKASAGSLNGIMKRGGLYKGLFLVRYLVQNEVSLPST